MRKIVTLDSFSDIPNEEAIYVFLSSRGLSKVVSTENIKIMDMNLNRAVSVRKNRWALRELSIMTGRSQYGILHPNDFSKEKLLYSPNLTRDAFISKLQEWYPEDYEFFLWHPEVLEGKWNKE
jgi:hypothetical protein